MATATSQADLPFELDSNTDLDAIMKTLEEDLTGCTQLVQEELFTDATMNGSRDKTESVSSDCSLSSFTMESDESCTPSETVARKSNPIQPDVNHSIEQQNTEKSGSSKHAMVTRRRSDRTGTDYNLRNSSIINRIQTEQRRKEPKKPKPKAKPPPLSKYRRRTANSRERGRMQEINEAFEVLRKAVPPYDGDEGSKMTKITTLRLALNYIAALRDMLGYNNEAYGGDSGSDLGSTANSDIACASPDSLPTSDNQVVSPAGLSDGSDHAQTSTLDDVLGLFCSESMNS